MQTISTETQTAIEAGSQEVVPKVTAEWLNSRFVENLTAFSTSDNYLKKTKDMNPAVFWQFNESDYAFKIQQDHPLANLWMLNEASGPTAIDYNGLNDGTYNSASSFGNTSLIANKAFAFTGGAYISVPGDIRYSPGYLFGFMSVETWINPIVTDFGTLLGKGDVDGSRIISNGYEWKLGLSSSNIQFTIYEPDGTVYVQATGATILTTSAWYHIVATWDGNLIKIYINGNFEVSARLTSGFRINMPYPNTSELNIGRMPDASDNYHGYMNGTAIYNTILNPAEISGHYNIGIGKTYDFSGNARSANLVNTDSFTMVKVNDEDALNRLLPSTRWIPEFDGNQFFVLNGLAAPTDDVTLEAWVKIASHLAEDEHQTIVAKGAESPTLVMQIGIDVIGQSGGGGSSEQFQAYVYNTVGTKFSVNSSGSAGFTSGYVHLLASVKNNVLTLYLNGSLQDSVTITGTRSALSYSFCVGRFGAATTPQFFSGRIFNVGYYPGLSLDSNQVYCRYYSAIRGSADDKSFNPLFMTADELVNGHYGYGHVWPVLNGKNKNKMTTNLSNNYDIAEDSTQAKTYKYEYGWWGNNRSDNTGFSASNSFFEKVTLTFNSIEANAIGLFVPEEYSSIKEYTLQYLDNSDIWHSIGSTWELAVGNIEIKHLFDSITNLTGICITILSTQLPYDHAKISELTPLIIDDPSDDIVSLSVKKTKENFDSSVPFGATSANTADITLQNVDLRYNPNNVDSDIYGLLTPDAKFKIALGWRDAGGSDGLSLSGA